MGLLRLTKKVGTGSARAFDRLCLKHDPVVDQVHPFDPASYGLLVSKEIDQAPGIVAIRLQHVYGIRFLVDGGRTSRTTSGEMH